MASGEIDRCNPGKEDLDTSLVLPNFVGKRLDLFTSSFFFFVMKMKLKNFVPSSRFKWGSGKD